MFYIYVCQNGNWKTGRGEMLIRYLFKFNYIIPYKNLEKHAKLGSNNRSSKKFSNIFLLSRLLVQVL